MSDLISIKNEITKLDIKKDRRLKVAAVALPVALSVIPASLFFVLSILFGASPPTTAVLLFFSFVSLIGGFLFGGVGSAATMIYRSKWLTQVRERVAIGGIKAKDVEWFKNEMKSDEKRALKEIKNKDLLLADAYQETLAARLTATRIVKSTKKELMLAKRRKNKLKYLKSERVEEFNAEVDEDISNLNKIRTESDEMLVEAESRLHMIEAASRRGNELAGNEMALKKLSARTERLPLALEAAKREEETRREIIEEIEAEFNNEGKKVDLLDK